MARIFSLIGSLCSTGSMRLKLAQKQGSAGMPARMPRTIGLNSRLPKKLFRQRHGTEACGLCAKQTFCPLSAYMEAECNSAGRTNLEVYVPLLPKRASWQLPENYIQSFAEHSSSVNVHSKEAANGRAGCSPSQNRCSKQSSSTQSALSFI